MTFPYGRPVLAIAVVAVVAGVALLTRPARPPAALTVWSFTAADATADRAAAGPGVRVDLIAAAAVDVRLSSLFMADPAPSAAAGRPDVVELEIGSVGKFLRGPADEVGFRPVPKPLPIPPSLLAPYTLDGRTFGVPVAVHPVVLVYRRDLLDLSAARTWPDVVRLGRRLALPAASPDVLLVMLQQRHVSLVTANGVPHLADPAVVDTVCWYARAAAAIGSDPNPAPGGLAADLADGTVVAAVAADWMVADIQRAAPSLAGKLAVRPLPRFDPADARTASWGGTMAAVPRFCPRPDQAWAWIEHAYLSPAAVARRWRMIGAIPPLPAAWAGPMFHQPDPFFRRPTGGRSVRHARRRAAPANGHAVHDDGPEPDRLGAVPGRVARPRRRDGFGVARPPMVGRPAGAAATADRLRPADGADGLARART